MSKQHHRWKFIPEEIPIELTDEQLKRLEELAELSGKPLQQVIDETVNELLAQKLPEIIENWLRRN